MKNKKSKEFKELIKDIKNCLKIHEIYEKSYDPECLKTSEGIAIVSNSEFIKLAEFSILYNNEH